MGMFGMFKTVVKEEAAPKKVKAWRSTMIHGVGSGAKSEAVKAMETLMAAEAEKKAEAATASTKASAAADDQGAFATLTERMQGLWEDFFYLILWLT